MTQLIYTERKTTALRRPALPCLSRHYTVNLLAGCPHRCRYCYAQSFQSNPGHGKIVFYSNTYELLKKELPRKRIKPEVVTFSTACEPFAPYPPVLEEMYSVMSLLLEAGLSLRVTTKSGPPPKFLRLFERHPGKVRVSVGVTTTDEGIRRLMEPRAAPVYARLKSLRELKNSGVHATVRMDPLIPGLTDGDGSFHSVFRELSDYGVEEAMASYLFVRHSIMKSMDVLYNGWSFRRMWRELYTQRIEKYCGSGTIHIPDPEYRTERYKKLKEIAGEHGILLRLCSCKNPDITSEKCHAPEEDKTIEKHAQCELFPHLSF